TAWCRKLTRSSKNAACSVHTASTETGTPMPANSKLPRVFAPSSWTEAQGELGASAERIALGEPSSGDVRQLIARSQVIRDLITKARQVARSKVPVVIQGESGTGKELLARLIHEASPRRGKPFIQVNCAAFSEALVESELFGHEKGAFTGAEKQHHGLFERGNTGSILLDEIGEMPLKLQAKLLRVLEEETFERVGGEQLVRVDVRVLETTNRELGEEMARGQFRADLFYRLTAMTLHLPPLRARTAEIGPLVQHFVECFGPDNETPVEAIAAQAMNRLLDYDWP